MFSFDLTAFFIHVTPSRYRNAVDLARYVPASIDGEEFNEKYGNGEDLANHTLEATFCLRGNVTLEELLGLNGKSPYEIQDGGECSQLEGMTIQLV